MQHFSYWFCMSGAGGRCAKQPHAWLWRGTSLLTSWRLSRSLGETSRRGLDTRWSRESSRFGEEELIFELNPRKLPLWAGGLGGVLTVSCQRSLICIFISFECSAGQRCGGGECEDDAWRSCPEPGEAEASRFESSLLGNSMLLVSKYISLVRRGLVRSYPCDSRRWVEMPWGIVYWSKFLDKASPLRASRSSAICLPRCPVM